jgi:proton-dependent oligopeptide transporter, POT family
MASTLEPGMKPSDAVGPEGYRTTPDQEATGWPPGIPSIVGNEVCERFSYYGMRSVLVVHLVALYMAAGETGKRADDLAQSTAHLFYAGVYALPMIGAILADRLLGKYRTILYLSLFYCLGHGALALWENWLPGFYLGLALIAFGAGGIKPCVSANVGDQFGRGNWFRVRTVYQIFYFSVNFGSFFATLLIPRIKKSAGPWLAPIFFPGQTLSDGETAALGTSAAFALPGILMVLATFIFWLGRRKFVHVPPRPGGLLGLLDTLSSVCLFLSVGHLFFTANQDWRVILAASVGFLAAGLLLFLWRQRLAPDDGFLAIMFHTLGLTRSSTPHPAAAQPATNGAEDSWLWQSSFWRPAVERFGVQATEGPVAVLKIISVLCFITVFWALFDQHSSSWVIQARQMDLSLWAGQAAQPNEIQALNPLLVMLLIPLLNLVYFGCDRLGLRTPPLGRITVGMFLTAASFVAAAQLQTWIDRVGDGVVWFGWQVPQYLLLTLGEVMVSITALEFAYTQAPKRMKSTIMSFLNLTISLGNVLVALLAYFGGLKLANFFWVFAGLMAAAALLFGLRSMFYVQKDYPQE